MKTYVETINVVLNNNYEEVTRFNSLDMAVESYNKAKKVFFDDTAKETIYESGERSITDGDDTLVLEFVWKQCSDEDFEMLHKASIATL